MYTGLLSVFSWPFVCISKPYTENNTSLFLSKRVYRFNSRGVLSLAGIAIFAFSKVVCNVSSGNRLSLFVDSSKLRVTSCFRKRLEFKTEGVFSSGYLP